MSEETMKDNWFKDLSSKTNSLSEQFGLDDSQTSTLRDYVISLARSQFRVGSKSGASWAFKQVREGKTGNPQPQPAV